MSHLRQYQRMTESTDTTVLAHLSTFFTGSAFEWWCNNGPSITTLDQLERNLKMRFDRKGVDPTSLLVEFSKREQGTDEDLLDYLDDIRRLAAKCPMVDELKAIEIMVDNARREDNQVLAARSYMSCTSMHLIGCANSQ